MGKILLAVIALLLLTGCDDSYKLDTTPIARDEYARIGIEQAICEHVDNEIDCLRYLKGRIQ